MDVTNKFETMRTLLQGWKRIFNEVLTPKNFVGLPCNKRKCKSFKNENSSYGMELILKENVEKVTKS